MIRFGQLARILAFLALGLLYNGFGQEKGALFKVGQFEFQRPDEWKSIKPASRMRAAQLQVPGKDGPGEVVFFYFGPSQGGGVQANVDRWLGQFEESRDRLNAKIEKRKGSDGKGSFTLVSAQGTFLSGSPFGPKTRKPDHALFAGILEHREGAVFVKMTGPISTVERSKEPFRSMVEKAVSQAAK